MPDPASLAVSELEHAMQLFKGGFLDDLSLPRCPEFEAWRTSHINDVDLIKARILRTLVARLAGEPSRALPYAHALKAMQPGDAALAAAVGALEERAREQAVSAPQPLKARPRVLLVDDYRDARDMYGQYLEYSGYQVSQAANGVEALQRALEDQPAIILMDLSLPIMDGWEATRRLKADHRTAGIPVVALTGHALAGVSERAREAGCDAFVTKPCLPEDLVREINRVL